MRSSRFGSSARTPAGLDERGPNLGNRGFRIMCHMPLGDPDLCPAEGRVTLGTGDVPDNLPFGTVEFALILDADPVFSLRYVLFLLPTFCGVSNPVVQLSFW